MKHYWNRISTTQQNQILVLVTALVLTGYGLWYRGIHKHITETENMISRRVDRIETRTSNVAQPQNTVALERQIKELQTTFENNQHDLNRVLQRFVSIDNPQDQQALRRELSELASGLGMRVIKLDGALKRSEDVDNAQDVTTTSDIDRKLGRPLLIFEAWGSYFSIQTLLDELNTLSYVVAPVSFYLIADEPNITARQALEAQQLLRVEMVLAI